VLSEGFAGFENAGDFLGLDVEFQSEAEFARDADFQAGFGSSPGAGVDVERSPFGRPEPYVEGEDEDFEPGGETFAAESPHDEGEMADDEYSVELEHAFALEPARSQRGVLVGLAFGIGTLAVAGYFFAPRFLGGAGELGDPAPQVARAPRTGTGAATTDPVSRDEVPPGTGELAPGGVEGAAPGLDDPAAVASADPETTTSNGTGGTGETADDEGWTDIESLLYGTDPETSPTAGGTPVPPVPSDSTDPTGSVPSGGHVATTDPVVPAVDASGAGAPPQADAQVGELLQSAPDFEAMSWVNPDDLDMIWRGTTIPREAITSPAKVLMPRVGAVRVHMRTGEIFEGRLYAVGQNRVWLDTEPGRLGLDGDTVARFERLPVENPGVTNLSQIVNGKRVAVRVPGGTLYGRVLSMDGGRVTLVTDDGGRVSLVDPVIEPIGTSRAIVVNP
jgi:hypothetical protein